MPALSAKSEVRGVSSIPNTSHIAKTRATVEFRILHRALAAELAQIANMATDKNGGDNHLRAWRNFRKLTVEDLAAKVGTSAGQLSDLENGNRGMSAKWLRRLAPILRTTPGWLLDHDPGELPGDILEIWGQADATQKRQLAEIARTLVVGGE